jgi:hypothetical protein
MVLTVGRVKISGAALLALTAVYFFDFNGLVWAVLAAAAVHELGHLLALRCLGYHVREFRFELWGLTIGYDKPMSYVHELITAAAGPVFSILLAVAASYYGRFGGGGDAYLVAGVSLVCGAFNLLPVMRLDGGKLLYDTAALLGGLECADRLLTVTSCAVIGGLLTFGAAVLIWTHVNFTLLLAGVWLLISYCKRSGLRIKSKRKKVGSVDSK